MSELKISFCTVCMNRLYHLRETLPINIQRSQSYHNLEFVLLDYNSSDGLETYIKQTFSSEIENGRLIFYRTKAPQFFNRSHSRNLVHKLATGHIICNLDADNYIDTDFASYIQKEFENDKDVFLTPIGGNQKRDVLGRTCVRRKDFLFVGGYDERMINYGFEDFDFINRLSMSGLKKSLIYSRLEAIEHGESERLSNEVLLNNLYDVYLNYLTPSTTDSLFFFKDNTYERGTMIDNVSCKDPKYASSTLFSANFTHSILEDEWIQGSWELRKNEMILMQENQKIESFFFDQDKMGIKNDSALSQNCFHKVLNTRLKQDAVMFLSQVKNRLVMERNNLEKKVLVNSGAFGNGTVFKNFDDEHPIIV